MTTSPVYAVTGASGQLGRRVVDALARRAGAASIVAVVRNPDAARDSLPQGVTIRQGDYEDPASLDAAFDGIDRLVLISSNALGARTRQHANAIEAARRAGVRHIAYTSVLHADTSQLGLAAEHRETEALLARSGIAHTLLRNGWYTENYTASIPPALQHSAFIGSAGTGRIASAARQDYAEAAAIAISRAQLPAREVLELAGDTAYTLGEFAAELSRQTGRDIPYADMPEADYRAALVSAGLPEGVADLLADSDAAAAKGALDDDSRTLSALTGRATTGLEAMIRDALAGGGLG